MTPAAFAPALRQFLKRIGPSALDDQSDLGLLHRFAAERDEHAFATLVARHGPMVRGVCQRVLRDRHDADDVFQATFLVLASKAAALDGRRPLASWLYIVARNLSSKLRARIAQRRRRELEAHPVPPGEPRDETAWSEVRAVLDAALSQLPEKYRAPLVLCHLQGLTHAAAARELGWPAGSLAKRLARGQQLLRARLAGRGVTLSGAALAALLAEQGTPAVAAAAPWRLGQAAVLHVASPSSVGLASPLAARLAGEALRSTSLARSKLAAAVLLGLAFLSAAVGSGLAGRRAEPTPIQAAEAPAEQAAAPVNREIAEAERNLRHSLDRQVNLDKGIDGSPLSDVLEYLTDRYGLTIRVNESAFADVGAAKVLESRVQLPRIIARLGDVLRLALGQIELDNGMIAGFRFNGNVIEIVPVEPSEPDERALPRKVRQRLLRPVGWPEGEAKIAKDRTYSPTFVETLEMIRTRYGEKVTVDKASFAALKFPPLADLTVPGIGLAGDLCLCDILDFFNDFLQGRDHLVLYRIKPDSIELTAVKKDSQELVDLWESLEAVRDYRQAQRKSQELSRKLDQPVTIDQAIEADTRLADALEFISDRYDVTIILDNQAFAAAGIDRPEETRIALPPQKEVKLAAVVQKLLDQVHKGDWTAQLAPGFGLVGRDSIWQKKAYLEIGPLHKHLRDKKPLTAEQWTGFWDDLANGKSGRVVLALDTLCQFPEQTVPYLRERLKPVPSPDSKKLAEAARWIPHLESDQFQARQKATDELEKLGSAALQPLRERLKDRPSLELRRRIELLVKKLQRPPTREQLREVRACRILEEIGTPEAVKVLEALARGYTGELQSETARAALHRLRN